MFRLVLLGWLDSGMESNFKVFVRLIATLISGYLLIRVSDCIFSILIYSGSGLDSSTGAILIRPLDLYLLDP